MKMSVIIGAFALALSTIGFTASSSAQVHTGGSNFTRAGVPHEGEVLRRRGQSGEFGRNNPWVPGSENVRRGGGQYGHTNRRQAHGAYNGRQYGGGGQVRRSFKHGRAVAAGAAGGTVVVTGRHRNVELQRGENYAVARPVSLTPGETKPAVKSPYENIGSKNGTTYFLVDVD